LSEKGTSDEEDEMLKRREEAIKEALLCDSSLSSDSSDSENIDDLMNSSSDDEKKPEEIKNEEEVQDEVQEVKQEMTIDKPEKAKLPRISDPNKQVEEEKISDDELEEKNLNLPSFKSIKKPTYRSADDKEIFSRSLFKGVGVTNSNTRPNTSISNEKNKTKQNNETKTVDMKTEEEHIPELGVDASMFKENYKKRKPSEVSERSTTSSTATTSTSFLNPKSLSPPKPAITPAISLDEDEEVISLSSDSDSEVNSVTTETGENGKVFPKRKKMLSEAELKEETKQAQKAEKERVERLKKKNEHMSELMTQRMSQSLSQEDDEEELILDFDKSDNPIAVHRNLVAKMKQHQKDGVKFMYDVSFGSLRDEVKTASGCILAHSMGLGKTLQLVSLVHTLIMHKVLETKRILIICPKSTILNWKDEFLKWLKNIPSNGLKIFYNADDKQIHERVKEIESWYDLGRPGVFLINYEAFRNMVNYPKVGKPAKTPMAPELIEKLQKTIKKCFVSPGPDLVVCDEGHYIKNEKGATRKAVGQIETRRRIILTGTPLQNNLCEYYAMVNWIKPGILGTMKEFNNLYANPIKDGQHNDSTPGMIKRMKQRSLILNNKLSNFVQRKEASVLKEFLPEKHEYVIFVPLTSVQEKLYKHFLASCDGEKGHSLMNDYTALRKIWTHPSALKNARDRAMAGELKVGEKTSKKNVDDDGEEEDVHDKIDGDMGVKSTWWQKFVTNDDLNSLTTSNKLILLFDILKMCEERKEKVLIFSSFVAVLNIVEEFMKKINECYNRFEPTETDLRYNFHQYKTRYEKNHDYIRLDGSTKRWDRQQMIARFNDESNTRLRCFLISAKAGGQGINLTSANRCIILDTSWNPSSDLQNIFRIYRLGQKKTCFAYR
jgi:transcriptional regulator ATRX